MKRLLLALGLALVLVAISGYLGHVSRRPSYEHGPLRVSFQGGAQQGYAPTKPQLEARSQLFSRSPKLHDRGVQSDRMVRLVNTGARVVELHGYNSSAPWYGIEVKKQGKWSALPMNYTTEGVQQEPRLNPNQSLEFPVIVPEGAESWRVALAYSELVASNRLTYVRDQVLRLRVLGFLPRAPRPESTSFMVRSEEVVE